MTVDIEKLEALAKNATPGPWWIDSHGMTMMSMDKLEVVFNHPAQGVAVRNEDTGNLSHWRNDWDASFIAAANPAAVLELIAELKQAEEDSVTWKGGISALGEALKKLTFCARTVTDGPDQALMAACDAAENALSLGGVSRAIDYIEGLKAENKELLEKYEAGRDRQNSITVLKAENAGLKTGYEAYERVNAELRAECEALRKNSARYQWLRDESESVHQFYLSTPIWFTGVKFSKENVDSTIDAAMSKEQSHD